MKRMLTRCFRSSAEALNPAQQVQEPAPNWEQSSRPSGVGWILNLVEAALSANRCVEVCQAQSAVLSRVFKQSGLCIQQWRGMLAQGSADINNLAIEILANSMDQGLHLLESCQEQQWAIQALLREENPQQFIQVTTEILECLRLLSFTLVTHADASQKLKVRASQRELLADLSDDLEGMLAAAAKKDRFKLWEKVENSNSEASMVCKLLHRKATEARSGIRDNIFIDYKQLVFKRQLSVGAYGTVHEATWLDYTFAVKVFREGDSSFSRELAALVPLNHPNIVRVVGYSYDDETRRCALVMEKMSMDLAKFLKVMKRESKNSLSTSIGIMLEVANAMKLLHSENIIHRDLKPANILVDNTRRSFTIKVADFGFARTKFITNAVTHATSRVGTRSFRAPEVYDSEKYSKKADVYSFAMVCYQILTGEMPFLDISLDEDFLDAVRHGRRPQMPDGCPAELANLTKQCWTGVPEERPDFWYICDTLKVLRGLIVTGCSWDEVKRFEVASRPSGLHCFDGGGYGVQDLKAVVRPLGNGTCGATHLATVCEDPVVVKCLKEAKANLMSKQQFQMLGRLSHKNVSQLRSYYCGERECLLVYNFVPGPSLATAFHGGASKLDWKARIRIAAGVANGIAYLHGQPSLLGNGDGFVHGGLHLSNVLLHEGEAILADAGVSYIVRRGAELSQASDMYAFGAMVLELLTRKPAGMVRFLLHQKRTREVFDLELQPLDSNASKELLQMLRLAMSCVSAAPPKMERVAELIQKLGVIRDDALPPGSALPS